MMTTNLFQRKAVRESPPTRGSREEGHHPSSRRSEFETRADKQAEREADAAEAEYMWRDKALELLIRVLKGVVGKDMSFTDYFTKYDSDHDAHLKGQSNDIIHRSSTINQFY